LFGGGKASSFLYCSDKSVAEADMRTIDEKRAQHIFRRAHGHLRDSPVNRKRLENLANDATALVSKDKYGNTWHARLEPDGTQLWAEIRGERIINGGVNMPPRIFTEGDHGWDN
jgi:Tfp pilus assembly protein PilF